MSITALWWSVQLGPTQSDTRPPPSLIGLVAIAPIGSHRSRSNANTRTGSIVSSEAGANHDELLILVPRFEARHHATESAGFRQAPQAALGADRGVQHCHSEGIGDQVDRGGAGLGANPAGPPAPALQARAAGESSPRSPPPHAGKRCTTSAGHRRAVWGKSPVAFPLRWTV